MNLPITNIQVQDANTLLITIVPSDFVTSEQAIIDANNASLADEISKREAYSSAIVNFQSEIDGNQANIVASQTRTDALNEDTATHQANIDAVTKVLPNLAPATA